MVSIKYSTTGGGNISFKIADVDGRTIKYFTGINADIGENYFTFETKFLSPGIYYVSLVNSGTNLSTKKLVVLE